jgi:hypothetical protein
MKGPVMAARATKPGVTDEQVDRAGIAGFPTGLSWHQQHRVARVVASAATDAADCAMLLATLGIHPADGLSQVSVALGRSSPRN